MTINSTNDLRDLHLAARTRTCGPGDVVPEAHLLDLTLTIAADLVLIGCDDSALVLDYNALKAPVDLLAREGIYITQEWPWSRIASPVAAYPRADSGAWRGHDHPDERRRASPGRHAACCGQKWQA